MKPSEIKAFVKACYNHRTETNMKLFIGGSPGCGKTQVMYQIGDELNSESLARGGKGVPVYVLQAMLYDPVEIKGLPIYQNGKAKFVPFEDMPSGEEGILFIDDLPHAPTQTQNALMRLINEGKCGSWDLEGLWPIAAGNRSTDRAGAKDLQTAIANRFDKVEFTVDYEEWRAHAVKKHFTPEVISYLATPYGQEWLNKFDPTHQVNPTPRSWEFASDIYKFCPKGILHEALSGVIGDEATSKFHGWMKVYDKLPDLNEIIKGKNIYPQELDILYAAISGLVSIASSFDGAKQRKPVFQRLVDYMNNMPENCKELGAWMSKDLFNLDPTVFISCNLNGWREKYGDLIL